MEESTESEDQIPRPVTLDEKLEFIEKHSSDLSLSHQDTITKLLCSTGEFQRIQSDFRYEIGKALSLEFPSSERDRVDAVLLCLFDRWDAPKSRRRAEESWKAQGRWALWETLARRNTSHGVPSTLRLRAIRWAAALLQAQAQRAQWELLEPHWTSLADLLTALGTSLGPGSQWSKGYQALRRGITPEVVERWLPSLRSRDSDVSFVLGALWEAAPAAAQPHRAAVLETFGKQILSAGKPVGPCTLQGWLGFVRQLSVEEWSALGSVRDRAHKRSPEVLIPTLVRLEPVLPPEAVEGDVRKAVEHVQASHVTLQEGAHRLLTHWSRRASPAAVVGTLGPLLSRLRTPGGGDRLSLLQAVGELAPEGPTDSHVTQEVVEGLLARVGAESQEEGKVRAWLSLLPWLRGPTTLPKTFLPAVEGALKASESVRSAALQVLTHVARGSAVTELSQVREGVSHVMSTAKGVDLPPAVAAVVRLTPLPALSQDRRWAAVMGPDSPLFKAPMGKLADTEHVLGECLGTLVESGWPVPRESRAESLLVWFLLYASPPRRRALSSQLSQALPSLPSLLPAFALFLGASHDRPSPLPFPTTPLPPRSVWVGVLRSLVGPSQTPETLSLVILCASHGRLTRTPPVELWASLLSQHGWDRSLFPQVVEILCGKGGLSHEFPDFQEASQRALAALAAVSPSEVLPTLIPKVTTALEDLFTTVEALTREEVNIYFTPEGELAQKLEEDSSKTRPDHVTISRERKKRGQHRLYSVEDEEWEAQVRAALREKHKAPLQESPEEALQRQHERTVREHVTTLVRTVERWHNCVTLLTRTTPVAMDTYVPQVLGALYPWTASQLGLVPTEALSSVTTHTLPRSLHSHGLVFAQALLSLAGVGEVDEGHLGEFLERVLFLLPTEAKGHTPASSMVTVLLTQSAAQRWATFALQERALTLLGTVVGQEGPHGAPVVGTALRSLRFLTLASPLLGPKSAGLLSQWALRIERPSGRSSVETLTGLPPPVRFSVSDWAPARELLQALLSEEPTLRLAALTALGKVPSLGPELVPGATLWAALWWIQSDPAAAEEGRELWERLGLEVPVEYFPPLQPLQEHPHPSLRRFAALALSRALRLHPHTQPQLLQRLRERYGETLPRTAAEEAAERERFLQPSAPLPPPRVPIPAARAGVAATLGALGPVLSADGVKEAGQIILQGLVDPEEWVREEMVAGGLELIGAQGPQRADVLLGLLESYLQTPAQTEAHDRARESVVLFLGSLAQHLPSDSPKIPTIVDQLLDLLGTPSETVQRAVAKSLPPLVAALPAKVPELSQKFLDQLQLSPSYALRRGSAYGLAGLVKGLGIGSLKKLGIMVALQEALENKKNPNARQGALLAIECLCFTLERLFEPYVIQLLPKLLKAFGDSVAEVRVATGEAARGIMRQLSAHGVKLVLPALLKALEDRNWRTKTGSIDLLGSMAFCAPRQLSACLPTIVPRLTVVLTDTHVKVQEAAREALGHIGSVIRNAEIQPHVPLLLQALDDPDAHAKEALEALIHTNFIHTIDPPSLSLLIPILDRGLRDRSTEVKKRAAQIVGNMCSLTEEKDLQPYLAALMGELKKVLMDPIPEVRATAAKALGSLVRGTESTDALALEEWLLNALQSPAGPVDRSGAAQGLSELLAAHPSRWALLLPTLLQRAEHPQAHVREGMLELFVFLPGVLSEELQASLGQVLPPLLRGLTDEAEGVREVALRGGGAVVSHYGVTALPQLLPPLSAALSHGDWRLRLSALQLLGDLLHRLLKSPTPDPLGTALGEAQHLDLLTQLYLLRADVSAGVRQQALLVWKDTVPNTPKALRSILPRLMDRIIADLGSESLDQRQVAGKTLGDLGGKLGDELLPALHEIFERGLHSPTPTTRQGVALALSEVLGALPKAHLLPVAPLLHPPLLRALQDPSLQVREAAGEAFERFLALQGSSLLDLVVPPLLGALGREEEEEREGGLGGLRELLKRRPTQLLPVVVPPLLTPPLRPENVRVLAAVAGEAGPALVPEIPKIIPALLGALGATPGAELRTAAEGIVTAIPPGENSAVISALTQALAEAQNPKERQAAAELLSVVCAQGVSGGSLGPLVGPLVRGLADPSQEVQSAAWGALQAFTTATPKDLWLTLLPQIRGTLQDLHLPGLLPGFCLPKGLAPVLPLYLHALIAGSPELREQAAAGLGELIRLTSAEALKPFVIQITGPLIRIIGDRFSGDVKAAILTTLRLLLGKGGPLLKAFLPQLQTTFLKALQDPARPVRRLSALALAALVPLHPRLDALITDLLPSLPLGRAAEQETTLLALKLLIAKAGKVGKTILPETLSKVGSALTGLLDSDEETIRTSVGRTLGVYSKVLPIESGKSVLATLLGEAGQWQKRHGAAVAVGAILRHSPHVWEAHPTAIGALVARSLKDEKPPVRLGGVEVAGEVLLLSQVSPSLRKELLSALVELLSDPISDVKIAVLRALKHMEESLGVVLPPVLGRARERTNIPVKLAAERVIVHALRLHSDPSVLQTYISSLPSDQAKGLQDYAQRVLSKLARESDSEHEDEEEDEVEEE